MTVLSRTPQNTNYLQASKFILSFDRIPTVQYFCQEANLPGVTMSKAPINTPLLDIYSPGNKLNYSPFNIEFTVNEGATDWQELYNYTGIILNDYFEVAKNDFVRLDQPLTVDPNVGGFGQNEKEIVLQNPLRIYGYLAFSLATMMSQIFLVVKKKQFEKVQLAEMNF